MRRSLLFWGLSVGSLALVCIAPGSRLFAQTAGSTSNRFVQDFEKHWTTAKALAVAVAQAMPAEDYSFKPVPAEMSFGEQMMHITAANYGYCAFLGGSKSSYQKPQNATKEEIVKGLGDSFDYCSKVFDGVTDAQLDQIRGTGDHAVDEREVMLGALVHMSHHRGQSEVYLRLKGITPPEYKW
jgi:uncharacterized damage-inducible protein DinB